MKTSLTEAPRPFDFRKMVAYHFIFIDQHSAIFSYFLAPIIVIVIFYLIYNSFIHPLSSIPGPLLARFSSGWLVHHARKGDMHHTMISLHKKFGKLVRTGPNEISTSDPDAIKVIYGL
jgi:hypothetical protein